MRPGPGNESVQDGRVGRRTSPKVPACASSRPAGPLREAAIVPKRRRVQDSLFYRDDYSKLIETFMAGRSRHTQESYNRALERFCAFARVSTPSELAKKLFGGGPGPAHLLIFQFRDHLKESKKSAATVNLHLAAIRSFVKFAKKVGAVAWELSVEGVPVEPVRDTRGPGEDGVNRLLSAALAQGGERALRDTALIRLMWDLGLREGECVGLDVEDVDFQRGLLWILGKQRKQKQPLTLPAPTADALRAWIRGRSTGAVFTNFDRAGKGEGRRLTGRSVQRIVGRLGRSCGLAGARPHGVRHAAITTVLDVVHGNVRVAQKFSRHKSADMVLRYDDNRQDLGGEAAKLVADRLRGNGNGAGLPFISPNN